MKLRNLIKETEDTDKVKLWNYIESVSIDDLRRVVWSWGLLKNDENFKATLKDLKYEIKVSKGV